MKRRTSGFDLPEPLTLARCAASSWARNLPGGDYGFPEALAKRSIHTLCVDQPGAGEALRLQDIPATPISEKWGSKWFDWLETQTQVDRAREGGVEHVGAVNMSFGNNYIADWFADTLGGHAKG